MKRSKSVEIGLIAAIAATLVAGCSRPEDYTRRCVDASGRVLPDSSCGFGGRGHWGYFGRGSSIVNGIGRGFSSSEPSSGRILSSSGSTIRSAPVSRGGFGSSGSRSFGG